MKKTILILIALAARAAAGDFTVTLTIPDAIQPAAILALSKAYGYNALVTNPQGGDPIANPETRTAFCRRKIGEEAISKIKTQRAAEAATTEKTQADTDLTPVVIK